MEVFLCLKNLHSNILKLIHINRDLLHLHLLDLHSNILKLIQRKNLE